MMNKMTQCTGVMEQITSETIDDIADLTAEVAQTPKASHARFKSRSVQQEKAEMRTV